MGNDRDFKDAIQRTIEGEGEPQEAENTPDIRIEAPTDPEVRPEVWKDVESLLFRGFITAPGEINGVDFLFKSLNHHEFQFVQWLGGKGAGRAESDRFYNTFLAYGVFMVDGQNTLSNRSEAFPDLVQFFTNLPHPAKSKLIRYLSEVNRRASNAVTLTEAFIMEQASRFKWAQFREVDLTATACTGVAGTGDLGLNYSQLVWRALNHYEDTREMAEREWDNAKFIGSCFAGKEIQKIYNQDKERRRKEREQRLDRRDKLLRQVLLGEDPEKETHGGRHMIVARTVQELAKQLEANLRGEKDWHDEVMDAVHNNLMGEIQAKRDRTQALMETVIREEGEREFSAYSSITEGLTPQEVQHRMARRRQIEAQRAASKMIRPDMDPRLEALMEKHSNPAEGTYQPQKVAQTNRDPSTAIPLSPSRPKTTPFRR